MGPLEIQWAFTLFVLFETWLSRSKGSLTTHPSSWSCSAACRAVPAGHKLLRHVARPILSRQIIAGIGAGAVYGTCVGNAPKWFPDKRGLPLASPPRIWRRSALTVAPIQAMINKDGFQAAFFWFGIGQGIIVMIFALFMFTPKPGQCPPRRKPRPSCRRRNFAPTEVLKPIFWLMYFMLRSSAPAA